MHFSDCRYCSRCHSEIGKDAVTSNHGWCEHCHDTVEVTSCKVPYWVLAVTLALLWVVHFSGTLGHHVFN